MQDKGRRHYCRDKPMSAHGFLEHVENRHRAAEICEFLRTTEISRVIHAGARLNSMELIDRGRTISLNARAICGHSQLYLNFFAIGYKIFRLNPVYPL